MCPTSSPPGPDRGRLALQHKCTPVLLRWIRCHRTAYSSVDSGACPAQIWCHSAEQGDSTTSECDLRPGAIERYEWNNGVSKCEARECVHCVYNHVLMTVHLRQDAQCLNREAGNLFVIC